MPPKRQHPTPASPETHARLLTTLSALETQRAELITSLSSYLPPSALSNTSTTTKEPSPLSSPNPNNPTTTATASDAPTTTPDATTTTSEAPTTTSQTPSPSEVLDFAQKTVKAHIKRLHAYNEVKDVALGMLGLIAEKRGVRVVEVMEEFGVGGED